MKPRLLLALGLIALSLGSTGCGAQRARQAELAARVAAQQARDEAERAAQRVDQVNAEAVKQQNKAGSAAEQLKLENDALRTQLAEAQAQLASNNKPPHGEEPPSGSEQKRDDPAAPVKFTHSTGTETPFYKNGPQQAQPPDGKFRAGTNVAILKEAGSYTRIRSEDGVEAFVAANAIKPLGDQAAMNITPLVEDNNQFALDLYGRLRAQNGNVFFSPSSISVALAMAYAGAAGNTEKEMAKTLHFQMPRDQVNDGMSTLLASWRTSDKKKGFRINLANRLWGQEGYEFRPQFLEVTRTRYGAELARLDFVKQAAEAQQTINKWVEGQTEDKIKDLIPSPQLLTDARLVLTNAIYFKGDWALPFDKSQTKVEDFSVSSSEKVKTPLMHQQKRLGYAAADGLQVLELRYGDGSLSMVVLLPEKVDGLAELEGKLSSANLKKWTTSVVQQQVVVSLPKFRTTSQFSLGDTLKTMGMASAFDPSTADFSGMTGNKDLFISAVIHKAFVDVDEEGTEAAAATGIVAHPTAAIAEPQKPPVFRADHPFVFMIRDNRNGSILFLGRVVDPR